MKRISPPPDTCDGGSGKFFCPATYSSDHFTCTDVVLKQVYWVRTVDCSYMGVQSGSYEATVPVRTLAEKVVNMGLSEISVPDDISGDNYFIQLSCIDNFTGECAKGLSAAPFSIVHLADPVVLTINKLGAGSVTDGNVSCASNRSDCLENYERGVVVTLSANAADPASIFTGWSGACSTPELVRLRWG